MASKLIVCKTCGMAQVLVPLLMRQQAYCARCETVLGRRHSNSRVRTAAFALAALCLCVPANIYPIMVMDYMGRHPENTVWGGVKELYKDRL